MISDSDYEALSGTAEAIIHDDNKCGWCDSGPFSNQLMIRIHYGQCSAAQRMLTRIKEVIAEELEARSVGSRNSGRMSVDGDEMLAVDVDQASISSFSMSALSLEDQNISPEVLFNMAIVESYHMSKMSRREKIKLLAYCIPRRYTTICSPKFINEAIKTFNQNSSALGYGEVPRSTIRTHMLDALEVKEQLLAGTYDETDHETKSSRKMVVSDVAEWLEFIHLNSYNSPSERDLYTLPADLGKLAQSVDRQWAQAIMRTYLPLLFVLTDDRELLKGSKRITDMPKHRLLEEFNAERAICDPQKTPFSMYFVDLYWPGWIREINNNDLISCVCRSCVNLNNSVHMLTDMCVQSKEIDGFIGRNNFLEMLFNRKGCHNSDFVCQFGEIPNEECYHMACSCSAMSSKPYCEIKEELFPKLVRFAFSHSSRQFKLHLIDRPSVDNDASGVTEAEVIVEMNFEQMVAKCLEVICANQSHFYEATKSFLAIKKLRSGEGQRSDEVVMEQDFSEEYTSRTGSLRVLKNI